MRTDEALRPIITEVEFLLAERRQLAAEGPHFIVTHGNHRSGLLCTSGETVEQVSMGYRWNEFPLYLSPTGLLIFDCLCRHRQISLTARRIAQILASDLFYVHNGANAHGGRRKLIHPDRVSIKVHIQRIREQIAKAAVEAGLALDPSRILISEMTDSNTVVYRLKASVEFRHCQF
ncbi:MAG TPA: hypothetical protein VIJ38_18215 [Acidobacteriaceae bacterium]